MSIFKKEFCFDFAVIPIKLVGGNTNASGRVELYHNGYYGTICNRNFDRLDLTVVCRMLGFENIPYSIKSFNRLLI